MSTPSIPPTVTATRTDSEVRQFLAAFFATAEQHDLPGFLALCAESEAFTVFEDKETYDWNSFVAFAQGFFGQVSEIAFELETCAIDPVAQGAAVATGIFRGTGKMTSGEPVAIRNSFTFVLVKQAERWRVKHAHESSL